MGEIKEVSEGTYLRSMGSLSISLNLKLQQNAEKTAMSASELILP